MSETVEAEPKAKIRPATFDRLRKKSKTTKRLKIYTEDIPEPSIDDFKEHGKPITAAQQTAYESAIADWQAQRDASAVVLTLQALGRKAYDTIVKAHPPTDEVKDMLKAQGQPAPSYNAETFGPALISATVVDPELSVAEWTILFDEWSSGENVRLFFAALEVNQSSEIEDYRKGFGRMPV